MNSAASVLELNTDFASHTAQHNVLVQPYLIPLSSCCELTLATGSRVKGHTSLDSNSIYFLLTPNTKRQSVLYSTFFDIQMTVKIRGNSTSSLIVIIVMENFT